MQAWKLRAALLLLYGCAALGQAASSDVHRSTRPTREELIGTWRLVGMEYAGSKGSTADPFYQAGSTGIIMYQPSGWMSVHIVAPHRRAWHMADTRLPAAVTSQDAQLKAAAFDSYYAYFGTWDLDEESSMLTHHVISSLIPAESGLDYAQSVTLERGRLVFTTRSADGGETIVRRKVWERLESRKP